MGTNDGGPAFPGEQGQTPDRKWNQTWASGMSLREWFAGHICVAMTDASDVMVRADEAASPEMECHRAAIADAAVRQADSLIAALAEKGQDDGDE